MENQVTILFTAGLYFFLHKIENKNLLHLLWLFFPFRTASIPDSSRPLHFYFWAHIPNGSCPVMFCHGSTVFLGRLSRSEMKMMMTNDWVSLKLLHQQHRRLDCCWSEQESYLTHMGSQVLHIWTSVHASNNAKISSLFCAPVVPPPQLVFWFEDSVPSGGPRYDNSSIGSPRFSGKSCNREEALHQWHIQ